MDPLIAAMMGQQFAENGNVQRQLGTQFLQSANFVNQQTQLSHQRVTGMFESKALQNLEEEGIADAILQNRAAAGQPGNAPSGETK